MNHIRFAFICFLLDSDDWPSMWIILRIAILCGCIPPPIYFLKDLENICRLKQFLPLSTECLYLGNLWRHPNSPLKLIKGGVWTQIHGKHEDKTWNIKLFLVWMWDCNIYTVWFKNHSSWFFQRKNGSV